MYIQIIECCYYLTQQQKSSSSLVTLLLGNKSALSNSENRDISYVGLARSVEINLEFVTDFYDKWKKTYKGKKWGGNGKSEEIVYRSEAELAKNGSNEA